MRNRFNSPTGLPPGRRRRFGFLTRIILIFVVACAFMLLVTAVFAPWGFYLGGHFHPLPYWQGWGRLNVPSAGGDYVVFVRVEPSSRGSKMYLSTNLGGVGYLCTPAGVRFRLSLGGSMARHLPLDTVGQRIYLYMDNAPGWKTPFLTDRRPNLGFYGNWGDRQLVLDDHKTLSAAFLPDGTLYQARDPRHRVGGELAHVVLKEGTYGEFEAACPAQAK